MNKKQFISSFLSLVLLFSFCEASYGSGRKQLSQAIVASNTREKTPQTRSLEKRLRQSRRTGFISECFNHPKQFVRTSRHLVLLSSQLPDPESTDPEKTVLNALEIQSIEGELHRTNVQSHRVQTESQQSDASGQTVGADTLSNSKRAEYLKLLDANDRVRKQTSEADEILTSEPQPTLDDVILEMQNILQKDDKAFKILTQQIRRDSRKKSFTKMLPAKYFSDLMENTISNSSSIVDRLTIVFSELVERDKFKELNSLIGKNRNKFYLLVKSSRFDSVSSISSFFAKKENDSTTFFPTPYLLTVQQKVNETAKKLTAEETLFDETDGTVMVYLMYKHQKKETKVVFPTKAQQKETFLKYTENRQYLTNYRSLVNTSNVDELCDNRNFCTPLLVHLKATKDFYSGRSAAIGKLQERINKLVSESSQLSKQALVELSDSRISHEPRLVKFSEGDSWLLGVALQLYNPGVYADEAGLLQKVLENDARAALTDMCQTYKSFQDSYLAGE